MLWLVTCFWVVTAVDSINFLGALFRHTHLSGTSPMRYPTSDALTSNTPNAPTSKALPSKTLPSKILNQQDAVQQDLLCDVAYASSRMRRNVC